MDSFIGVMSNSDIRAEARAKLRGNWGMSLLVCLLYSVILGAVGAVPYLGPLVNLLISGAFVLGLSFYFISIIRHQRGSIEQMFAGFSDYVRSLITMLLIAIFTFLWTLLLIIPGIIASLRYSQSYYILLDHPELSASEAIDRSKEMMIGYKWKLFCLYFSFIGWALLSILTLGIGFLWLYPYIEASKASFYQNLKDSRSYQPPYNPPSLDKVTL